tara:strand:+ start:25671 stop:26723 length:1053 start_codon:yes stop_codon:yes gene_type:complete
LDLSQFDFDLPDDRIALRPVSPRDACKLLVCEADGSISDAVFRDIEHILRPGDLLIANDTRVVPALLNGVRPARDETGQNIPIQVNLLSETDSGSWLCFAKPGRRLRVGDQIGFGQNLSATVLSKKDHGEIELKFSHAGRDFSERVAEVGMMPIPPYIAKQRASDDSDQDDYQTVFANEPGSVAAPTAGLHFTENLLQRMKSAGFGPDYVTLHVGAGTFAPLTEDELVRGKLHEEWCAISETVAQKINETKASGGRVIAVGTTALRTLESRANGMGRVAAGAGRTDIFIRPGYEFQIVDGLVTNFHLPRSSLFMMVCALKGIETMQACYAHAIENDYSFYSYGDACLLIR